MTPAKDKELSDLMRAVLAGDESGYARLLGDIARLIRPIARRKIGSGAGLDPEDIVQETLLAVHLKRHTWRPEEPIGPWIYAIARYKIIDAYRRRGHRVELDIAAFADTLAGEEKQTVLARDVQRALDCLSDGQRQVVSAIGVEGASIEETAKRLGMKETAVRVALHRGLAAIAAKFGKTD
ncbi:sigma-70 family RNA polymerase sigma factor [Pelagibacterium montanilacus]|uniref:sigma-70 family RNA polymerase sigma factor n=1 Tax=Pelagibacterium montanilacus TaxID=2185280 RepID=UPI000F8CCB04|nr:sigma-70 family RNA polymerase sigma factor [Pelagibacterium montanilacus]